MKEFWDKRYSENDYVYGTEPNHFFKEEILKLTPGRLLLPAEGEGRNAVYAAKLGWDVVCFDQSSEGKRKALQLAQKNKTKIDYRVCDFQHFNAEQASFDCVAFIFAHVPGELRSSFHTQMMFFLRPEGNVFLEGYSKEQIDKTSGGPKDITMLFSFEELESDFKMLRKRRIEQKLIHLTEGPFHQGEASVIRVSGVL